MNTRHDAAANISHDAAVNTRHDAAVNTSRDAAVNTSRDAAVSASRGAAVNTGRDAGMSNAAFWDAAAAGWIHQADRHDELGRPFGAPAMARLQARPGERILDVGCGCGGTTAEIAERVGPGGRAVGVDLAAAMIAAARERFPGRPGLEFHAADIEAAAPVPGAPFDAAFSRMTLMLLADPVAGAEAIRRALRPGGRLAATVFRGGAENPWLPMAMLGAAPHVGALPPLPVGAEPGPFALADPGRIATVLRAAGFVDVAVERCDVALVAPDEPEVVAEWLVEVGPAGAAYRQSPPAARAAARAGAARLLERFRTAAPGGHPAVDAAGALAGYRIPVALWLVTAATATGGSPRSRP